MSAGPTAGITLADRTHVCDGGRSLVGGGRVVRLSPAAAAVVARCPLVPDDAVAREVATLLLDRGLVDPWWPTPPAPDAAVAAVADVTVVVPTRDRPASVAALLAALPAGLPVVVVDDGSADPDALAAVAAAHGAGLVRHDRNRGPAAARNSGMRAAATAYVAFCDSDVVPQAGWLGALRRHLDDPSVAAVAPRVLGRGRPRTWLERYETARSSLDLGPTAAAVTVHGRVAYVPSACLLVRRDALGDGFEESMRAGEDVDLVWRLLDRGRRVRYEPGAVVRHDHRTRPGPWLARKFFYGTSAAPLAARHPGKVAPLVLSPWSTAWSVALLAQRRWSAPAALAAAAVSTGATSRRLAGSDRPLVTAATLTLEDAVASTWQTASSLVRHHWPLALLWAVRSPRGRHALLAAALLEGVADRRRVGADGGVTAYVVAHRLDDLAYGAGVWWGAWRARSVRCLLPTVRWPRRRTAQAPS